MFGANLCIFSQFLSATMGPSVALVSAPKMTPSFKQHTPKKEHFKLKNKKQLQWNLHAMQGHTSKSVHHRKRKMISFEHLRPQSQRSLWLMQDLFFKAMVERTLHKEMKDVDSSRLTLFYLISSKLTFVSLLDEWENTQGWKDSWQVPYRIFTRTVASIHALINFISIYEFNCVLKGDLSYASLMPVSD